MAEIKSFTERDQFWATIETIANWPERLVVSGGSASNFLDEVFVPDTAEIFLADERCVPDSHKDSNAGLIRKKLREKNFVDRLDFYQAGMSAAECAAEYDLKLKTDQEHLFDLVVLGVGPDGHTASLFPESDALTVTDKLCVATEAPAEFAIKERLSLTFEALRQAKTILVLLQGSNKADIFKTITDSQTDPNLFPARTLLDWPNVHIFHLNA